jgi:peroxiredoxin
MPPRDAMARKMAAEDRRVGREYPAFADAYDKLIARLKAGAAGDRAPKAGDILPRFMLPDDGGRLVGLGDFSSAKAIVVSVNRGHWCTYCRVEFESLRGISDEIERRGGAVLAITPDRQRYVRALKKELGLPFPVLSDMDNAYAMSLGLVVWCGDEVRALYRSIAWNASRFQPMLR